MIDYKVHLPSAPQKNIENQYFIKAPKNLRGFFYAPALHFRYRENGPADNSYAFRIARTREQRIIRDTGTAIALHFQAVENIASLATKDTPHSHHSIFGIVDNQ